MNTTGTGSGSLNAAELVALLRTIAAALRKAGSAGQAEKFERQALEVETSFTEEARTARLEQYRADRAAWEARVKYQWDWKLESFKATMVLAQRAITSAMVVNGGAALALLAYMGDTWRGGGPAAAFLPALGWLASGVILAAATFALSYWTQQIYSEDTDDSRNRGRSWHIVSVSALLTSYLAFLGGVVTTYSAFSSTSEFASAYDEKKNMPPPRPAGPAPKYPTEAPQPRPANPPAPPKT